MSYLVSWIVDARPKHADLFEETTPSPTDTNAGPIPQKHDLLDVSDYLDSGLATSPIDQWFTGSHPTFKPSELPKPAVEGVRSAVAKARLSLKQGLKWPPVRIVTLGFSQNILTVCYR